MEHWYLLRTKPRQERVAAENLLRQNFHILAPCIKQARRRRSRWEEVEEPMFPGYLFIRMDLETQNSAPIRSTVGVTGLVRFGGPPTPIPEAIIVGIKAKTEADAGLALDRLFRPGDPVTIMEGGLAGLNAVFQAQTGEERVILLLDLLGRTNSITVSRHHIAPV